eukprot:6018228-Heterocapsa_arctica.AAC.1
MFEQPSTTFNTQHNNRSTTFTTLTTFKQTPEDRSNTFKHIQQPSKPCAPVCVHVWGALIYGVYIVCVWREGERQREKGR